MVSLKGDIRGYYKAYGVQVRSSLTTTFKGHSDSRSCKASRVQMQKCLGLPLVSQQSLVFSVENM